VRIWPQSVALSSCDRNVSDHSSVFFSNLRSSLQAQVREEISKVVSHSSQSTKQTENVVAIQLQISLRHTHCNSRAIHKTKAVLDRMLYFLRKTAIFFTHLASRIEPVLQCRKVLHNMWSRLSHTQNFQAVQTVNEPTPSDGKVPECRIIRQISTI
jgi:hypothetical protein